MQKLELTELRDTALAGGNVPQAQIDAQMATLNDNCGSLQACLLVWIQAD